MFGKKLQMLYTSKVDPKTDSYYKKLPNATFRSYSFLVKNLILLQGNFVPKTSFFVKACVHWGPLREKKPSSAYLTSDALRIVCNRGKFKS